MTLDIRYGDLFTTTAPALGHGVNVDGLMGAGIAVMFQRKFTGLLLAYRAACRNGVLRPGGVFPWRAEDGRWIYNIASQDRPGRRARLEWVRSAAAEALEHADANGVSVIALPQIGCGIGGLAWDEVAAILEDEQSRTTAKFEIWVFER